ncbi:MAG: terminase large subunit [Clostridium lundense]|nr:terminase large subunit [Clostridium lundense]
MIKYADDYNPILEYWSQIENKEVIICDKLYRTYKKVINDLNTPGEFFYSPKRGNHIIEFIENFCRHSKGKMGGKPVILELWEKAMLATIFGFINIEGIRKYQFAELIIAKKNGKSLLSSCVGLYLQVGDGEAGPEVYSVATKKDQAKIIWQESKRMVKKSPTLRKRIKTLVAEMDSDFNDGVFKPLASDSDSLDGLNVHGALMDEIHQWKNGKALYDIIADGITAREQPLIFVTTTAGTIREDIYDMKYDEAEMLINGYDDENGYKDERSIYFIYELDNRKEWIDEKCWQKANPGLGTIKNARTLKEKVEKAKKNPLLVKNLLCKEFNIRETSSEAWLTFEQLNNTDTFDIKELKPRYGIGGADLSSTTDLTCATIIFRVPNDEHIYVKQMYFLPEDLLEKRVQEDKIPYDIWRDLGLLRITPGNRIDKTHVTQWFLEMQNEYDIYIYSGGYDAWSAEYWVQEMKDVFGKEAWEAVYQGKKTLSGPMKSLGADLEKKIINYNNNPILKWCLSNTAVDIDKNDNIQPIKTSNQRRRIDGLASLLDAYVQLERVYEGYMSVI